MRADKIAADDSSVTSTVCEPLVDAFAQMVMIRRFEELVLDLRTQNIIAGSVHLCSGQEAIPTGAVAARASCDPVFTTYRGHGWALACGLDPGLLLAELCGKEAGVNGGRGGSAYFSAPQVGFFGENSIVGAGAPLAVGAALASRYDHSDRVALVAFGDGAMNQGAVHEAMNFAAALALPVVFICENNGYSELTPIATMVGDPRLSRRALAYGFSGQEVDGNDPVAVRDVVSTAVARARGGGGPTLIEAHTYRIVGHYIGDPEGYRPPGELEAALQEEPIARCRRALTTDGWADDIERIEEDVAERLREAVAFALGTPAARDPFSHLYAQRAGG